MKASLRLVVASFAVALAASLARAERVDAVIQLGGTANAAVTTPGIPATIGFLVTQGTGRKLAFSVKRAKGSTIAPEVKLIAPDGSVFDIPAHGGSVKPGPTSWSAKLADVPTSGFWRLEVSGGGGSTGGFAASVKGSDTLKTSGALQIAINAVKEVEVEVADGAAITISASRDGSGIVNQVAIVDPNGVFLNNGQPFPGSSKNGKLSLKALRLPVFGKYKLRFSGAPGTGGGMKYTISTAAGKPKGPLPIADAGPSTEAEPGMPFKLDGSHSTPAGTSALVYRWAQVDGPAVTLAGAATSMPTFTAPDTPGALVFQLSVTENGALSKASTIAVQIAKRPVADAGRSRTVATAAAVTLDGSRSLDRRGKGLRYAWRQVPGDTTSVTLSDTDVVAPTFTAPNANAVLHFGLTVDDGNARSFEDVIVIAVGTGSVADAGREQYVSRMASVHLSGTASVNASGVFDAGVAWTQISGTSVTLANATTLWPSFTAPRAGGDLEFRLTIDNVTAASDVCTVHVRPNETNLPAPAACNGPLNIASGPVSLSAAATADPTSDPLAIRWAQIFGPAVPMNDAAAASTTATIPAGSEIYAFGAIANDGLQYGSPDVVTVRNSTYSGLPVAVAGANLPVQGGQPITAATTVLLDGSGSSRTDGTTGPLTYQWTQVSGKDWFDVTQSSVPFNPAAQKPQIRIPPDVSSVTSTRTIVMQLVVDHGTGASRPDFVSITFSSLPLNGKPAVSASASEAKPLAGSQVTLTGAGTDRDNDPLTFKWTQTAGLPVTFFPNATSQVVTFTAPDAATPLVFTFAASDPFDTSTTAPVTVTVDRKPTASVVVTPLSGTPGTFVTMDGQSSSDPEGVPVTYLWTQVSGPTITFNPTAAVVTFTAQAGAVVMRLVVNDGRQNSDPKNSAFSASDPPKGNATSNRANAAYDSTVSLSANPTGTGPFTFTWRQINSGSDPVCTLSSTTAQNPTFLVPVPAITPFGVNPSATFGVVVSDPLQSSSETMVKVSFFASLNDQTQTSSTVMSIIASRCVSCHAGSNNSCPVGSGSTATGYGMQTKNAFLSNSIAKPNCSGSSKVRLPSTGTQGASGSQSYFFDRLKAGGATPRMPTSGNFLSQQELNLIQDWIDQGVQDN